MLGGMCTWGVGVGWGGRCGGRGVCVLRTEGGVVVGVGAGGMGEGFLGVGCV